MSTPSRFIDLFAGCGGLSLGLLYSGWTGLFAVEKSPLAFETLRLNLVDGDKFQFDWPEWLHKKSMSCEFLLENYSHQLMKLNGKVELIVGGPPCQGFSTAGKRNPSDPRNAMTEQYLRMVDLIQPQFLVIENVSGFNMCFEKGRDIINKNCKTSYAKYIEEKLESLGYNVYSGLINCADFGVPQTRNRFIMICELRCDEIEPCDLFKSLENSKADFLKYKGFDVNQKTSAKDALSDLETEGRVLIENIDSGLSGYYEIDYAFPCKPTFYQSLMHADFNNSRMNSLRLPKHKIETVNYFKSVHDICRPGRCLSKAERESLGSKKHSLTVLSATTPSPTVTTLPDDILHYSEARILTARENARLQSFPDWFHFTGKYTTGGKQRTQDCPRYTQIGNAVPPLLSEAIGKIVLSRLNDIKKSKANLHFLINAETIG
ncbi:DNA cytosine methyltransferase [Serratia aquatilis]|uniref:Cytosine-specific methyltransferase n=1 Tax=Serratia aquatilis TaxID=1737515 RepID=A0ABV6EG16_9GAMM